MVLTPASQIRTIASNLRCRLPRTWQTSIQYSKSPRRAQFHTTSPWGSKPNPNTNSATSFTSTAKTSSPTSFLSIPGPSWLWVEPLTYPFRAYSRVQRRRPYVVQLISSIVIYFLGDLASQSIQNRTRAAAAPSSTITSSTTAKSPPPPKSTYDPQRAIRSVTIGAISAIPSYRFFLWLSHSFNVPNRPYLSLLLKVVFNQLAFAPIFNSYFFSMHSLLSFSEGPQPQAAWRRVCDTVPTSWLNSCKFWPVVTAFSFTFVPMQHRSVFAGVVAIGWQSYLGLLNQRAVTKEKTEEGRAGDVKALA